MASYAFMKNPKLAIVFVTTYLGVFTIASQTNVRISIMLVMFAISPFLLLWMVYTVLRFGDKPQAELKDEEEWGYEDFDKKSNNFK